MASVSVPRLLNGGTVVCLGAGPSLTPDDVDYCRGKAFVIAINNSVELAPWADALYACDEQWWGWHPEALAFKGLKFSLTAKNRAGVSVLKHTGVDGLETDPRAVRTGLNSGYQAINIAVHLGASQIVLLGYDMQAQRTAQGVRWHWHGSHTQRVFEPPVDRFLPLFKSLVGPLKALGIEVINCTPTTKLTCFPCRPLRDVLLERAA